MAKDLLDFSKFKKIFEDDKNTHLQHPKGHTIIVAHVALSPKLKKQIADLPMHPEKMVELAQDIMEHMPHRKMAEGGEAKPFKGYNPEKHSRTGGLNDEYREKYNREHGSDLKRPVTGNPKPGTEAAGRKKSFCARMKGVKGPTSEGGELTPKGAALKRWNCHAHGGKVEDTDHDEECMHYAGGGEIVNSVQEPGLSYNKRQFGPYNVSTAIEALPGGGKYTHDVELPAGQAYDEASARRVSKELQMPIERVQSLRPGESYLKGRLDHNEGMRYAKGGEAKPAVSRLDMNYKDVTKRIPELTEAAGQLAGGKLSAAEYDALVNKHKPVEAYGFVPQPATREDAMRALNESKRKMYGKTSEIQPGEQTDLRLDIPAYKEHGVWVNSIHRKDAPTVYGSVSAVNNARMVPSSEKALRVAAGGPKAPFAVIRGDWHPMEEKEAVEKAQKYLKHKDWKQVGYDPERHGYFYDRESMQPIEGAEQIIQIGPLVLAKKPKYGKKEEQLFAEGGDVEMYAKGGATARKAAKEYDWNSLPGEGLDLWRETPASMFDPEGRKLTKKAQEKKLFGPTGEPDPDTKQGSVHYANQQKAIARYMESLGVPMVESRGKFQLSDEIIKDIKAANRKRVKAGLAPLPVPSAQDIQESPEYEKSPTSSTLRGAQFYRSLLQKPNPKPDWRSGKLEAQRNIGAKVHELGHIPLLPKNIPIGEAQEIMDEGSERAGRLVDPVTGESRQGAAKQIQEEIQPMGAENKFRAAIGIPAYGRPQYNDPAYGARMTPLEYDTDESGRPVVRGKKYESGKHKGEYKEVAPPITSGSQPRISLDTQQPYATRLTDEAGELYDLIAQSKNMSPETRQRVLDLIGGITRMREEGGTVYTPSDTMTGDTLVNLRGQGRTQEAEERLRTRGENRFGKATRFPFAEGGQVGMDAIKKERYYADGGRVMLVDGGDPAKAPMTAPVIETDDQVSQVRNAINALPSFDTEDMDSEYEEQPATTQGVRTHYAAPLPGMPGGGAAPAEPVYDEEPDVTKAPSVQQPQQIKRLEYPGRPYSLTPEKEAQGAQYNQQQSQQDQIASMKQQVQKDIQQRYNHKMARLGSDVTGPDDLFGPNGEAPKNFDPMAYESAENEIVQERKDKNIQDQQNRMRIEQQNIVRARAGIAPLPTGQAPGVARPAPTVTPSPVGKPAPTGQAPATNMGNLPERIGGTPPSATYANEPTIPEFGTQTPQDMAIDAYRREADALRRKNDIAIGIAKANMDIERQSRQSQQKVANLLAAQIGQEQKNNEAYAKAYMDEKIDPMKAWTDKSVPGKIASVLGILVGGFATGRDGVGENPALKVLQYQLDKEIEAQKTRLARYPEVMKMGRDRLSTVQNAALTLKAQYGEIATRQLAEEAAKYGIDASNAEFQKALSTLQQKYVQGPLGMIAFNKLSLNPNLGDEDAVNLITQARNFNPEYGNQLANKYLVGYGFSLNDLDPNIARQVLNFDVFEKQATYLLNLIEAHKAGKYIPSETKTEIQTIAKALMKDLAHANAMDLTEGSAKWLKDQIGDPVSLWGNLVADNQALKTTLDELNVRKASALRALGYPESSIPVMMKKAQYKNKREAMSRNVMHLEPLTAYAPAVPPVSRAPMAPGAAPAQGQPNTNGLDFRPRSP